MPLERLLRERILPRLNHNARVYPLPDLGTEGGIPRIVHQTYPTAALPEVIQKNLAEMRGMNPGWEFRLYDDNDMVAFIRERFHPVILEHYLRINPVYGAARADLFRYLLMYRNGGVYLDIKSSCHLPLDRVVRSDDQFVISQWGTGATSRFPGWGVHQELSHVRGGEFQNWHIIAAPGHPFLRAVLNAVLSNISRYVPSLHGVGQHAVLTVTGPIAYTLAIAPLLEQHSYRLIDDHHQLGLEYSILAPREHHGLFVRHYSTLGESLIALNGPTRALDRLIAGARYLRDTVVPRRSVHE